MNAACPQPPSWYLPQIRQGMKTTRDKIAQLGEQLAQKQVEREALQESIPRLILQHVGEGLAGAKERRRLVELADEIHQLERARAILEEELRQLRQREINLDLDTALIESRRVAQVMSEKATALQEAIAALIPLADAVRQADHEFMESLGGAHPPGFEPHAVTANLMRRMELALYVASEGRLRPRVVHETFFQIKERGFADIVRWVGDYTRAGLTGRKLLEDTLET